ncbi:hypothetical protein DSCA_17510 [Desulfosarcina alkanivorans]|uniref:Solute-binding protein family 3/N-terminal domain-containing protein n=1 Tax=Desulfosarcina alkanivorans TaxID=571177 RepID=A0A5K7YLV6_9BACT|nr:transporter substrate-binding domain-containing protein [Desulfosarcina alkanivorans]BBO67821.1 hypothetical protein DSCA_17510 [Desulfosarcina alkanivorans]
MKKIIILATAVLLIAMNAQCETITIVADEFCPYNCEPSSSEPGYMIEAAVEILGAAGHQVNYSLLDWDQAVEEAGAGKYNAVVGAAKEDAPGFIFPEEPMGGASNAFYTRKDDNWTYSGEASLKGKKIVGITSYTYDDKVDALIASNGMYVDSLEQALEALLSGKADILPENQYVMSMFTMKNFISDAIRKAGDVDGGESMVYVAFSPANPKSKEYADTLTRGLKKMKTDGTWGKLIEKYGLSF